MATSSRGGARAGAGRPQSEPTKLKRIPVDSEQVIDSVLKLRKDFESQEFFANSPDELAIFYAKLQRLNDKQDVHDFGLFALAFYLKNPELSVIANVRQMRMFLERQFSMLIG